MKQYAAFVAESGHGDPDPSSEDPDEKSLAIWLKNVRQKCIPFRPIMLLNITVIRRA